jgi:DNA repair protein RecO (recombination protein O)
MSPREKSLRTEAIVLRRIDFGEADRLLTLYSRDYGKIRALAKGARKPNSRKTGHVELFMRTQFMIATGREIGIVTQAELVEPYSAVREDLIRTTYAAYAVELLDKFTADDDKNPALYDLLRDALGWFNTEKNILLAARYYELRLLSLVGYQPQLFYCAFSNEPIEQEEQFFSAELGGLLRPSYHKEDRRARPISAGAVKVLRYVQTHTWEAVQPLQLRRDLHAELEQILHYYLIFLLERHLKSVDFLRRLRREADLFVD